MTCQHRGREERGKRGEGEENGNRWERVGVEWESGGRGLEWSGRVEGEGWSGVGEWRERVGVEWESGGRGVRQTRRTDSADVLQ